MNIRHRISGLAALVVVGWLGIQLAAWCPMCFGAETEASHCAAMADPAPDTCEAGCVCLVPTAPSSDTASVPVAQERNPVFVPVPSATASGRSQPIREIPPPDSRIPIPASNRMLADLGVFLI